ncbi:MAG TPA: GNAT family N-acetyltransferase [Spirochaetia bacterium]|nr:GNAT family N-acetyltransferase [Spirochaetia bacterium]
MTYASFTNPVFRDRLTPRDRDQVLRITASSGFFTEAEVAVAVELVDERLAKGETSGYHFLFTELAERTVAYSCFGPIACTLSSFDLFWIAVEENARAHGLGSLLLAESERLITGLGGTRIYVETSSRPLYAPTRLFYERRGYRKETVLEDFYAPDDGKVIYVKVL